MTSTDKPEIQQYKSRPFIFKSRGIVMILLGGMLVIACISTPEVMMLSESSSWLPIVGIIVLVVGLLRCIDAFMALTPQGYLMNMHGGVLDMVVGGLVLFSVGDGAEMLVYLIAGYLITQGILRNTLLSVVSIRNPLSNRVTGIISIIMGLLIWLQSAVMAHWILALALSIDICFRGWALIMLASSIKKNPSEED